MISKLSKIIIPAALAIVLIGCTPIPIHNVENAPVNASNANYDLSDVTKAIKRAGITLGWQMKEQTPGHIVGTLRLRDHVAVVDITYTLDEYSINYKDSSNLKYNPSNNTIHKNYNGWIKNLTNGIDAQLVSL
jgi:hypothetical protein